MALMPPDGVIDDNDAHTDDNTHPDGESQKQVEHVTHGADLGSEYPGTQQHCEDAGNDLSRTSIITFHDITRGNGVGKCSDPVRDKLRHQYLLEAESPECDHVYYTDGKYLLGISHGETAADKRSGQSCEDHKR